jgi:hypothetical protein
VDVDAVLSGVNSSYSVDFTATRGTHVSLNTAGYFVRRVRGG